MCSELLLVRLFVYASFGLDNHKTEKPQGENKLSDMYNCLNPDQSTELQTNMNSCHPKIMLMFSPCTEHMRRPS